MRGTARARRSARVESIVVLRRRDALYTRCYVNRLRAGSERRENHNALFTLRMNCVWWGCVRASVGSASRHSRRRAPLHTGLRGRQAEAGRTPADTCRDTWLGRQRSHAPRAWGPTHLSSSRTPRLCAWLGMRRQSVRCCLAPRHAPPPSRAYVHTHGRGRVGEGRHGRVRLRPPLSPGPRARGAHTPDTRDTADGVCARGARGTAVLERPFRIIRHMRLWPIYEQISLRQPQQRTSEQDEKKQHAVHSCPGLPHPHARIEAVSAHTTPLMGATNRYRRARATHHFPTAHRRGGSREPPS